MERRMRRWLSLVLLVIFLTATGLLAGKIKDGISGSEDYGKALEIARGAQPSAEREQTEPEPVLTQPAAAEEKLPRWCTCAIQSETIAILCIF